MIKLNKQVNGLYKAIEKVDAKMDAVKDTMDEILEKAINENRKLTNKEQAVWNDLQNELEELRWEYCDIQNAINTLEGYCIF